MATLYFNTSQTGSNNWDNIGNWWTNPGATGDNILPQPTDELYIESTCDSGIPSTLDYYITIISFGTMTLVGNYTLSNAYYILIEGGGSFNVSQADSTFTGDGLFNNSGTLSIESGCYFTLNNTFTNSNILISYGFLTLNSSSINYGTFNSYYAFSSNGVFTNAGYFYTGESFNNNAAFNNDAGSTFISYGSLTNSSTFINAGSLTNNSSFNNNGILVNNNTFNNANTLSNDNVVTNNGTINNTAGSTFKNVVTFTNNGTTTLAATSHISLRPTSSFINNGTFIYGTKYTTRFKGEIFSQVPSSASWGNALL